MSSYITRQEQFVASTSKATGSEAATRRRSHDDIVTDSGSDEESNYVTTMLPPRKKARHSKGQEYVTSSSEIKAWLAAMKDLLKNTFGMQKGRKDTAKNPNAVITSAPMKSPLKEAVEESKKMKNQTPRTADKKKPRKPRRCVICMAKHGEVARAIACPGKMNRSRCALLNK